MTVDIARRFVENPLLSPVDLPPSHVGLTVTSVLNPGIFRFEKKTWMVLRVAERPLQEDGFISFPVLSHRTETSIEAIPVRLSTKNRVLKKRHIEIIKISINDPDLMAIDSRVIVYRGTSYLTTLSHLRLLCSDDGIRFYEPDEYPYIHGQGKLENFGIEDCRVVFIDHHFLLTYTAVSDNGVGVGLKITKDWKHFKSMGMMLPPHNKDCVLFDEKINGLYHALHRPSSVEVGGNYIWLAESPDGVHWGNHRCLLKTRQYSWDSTRVGAGAAPIRTLQGWLAIYHGANKINEYCLGAFLMDLQHPYKVLARSEKPIMIPREPYEVKGFFSHVVFTNGHTVNGDELTVYYGASDEVVCAAKFSIEEIMQELIYG